VEVEVNIDMKKKLVKFSFNGTTSEFVLKNISSDFAFSVCILLYIFIYCLLFLKIFCYVSMNDYKNNRRRSCCHEDSSLSEKKTTMYLNYITP
jgi:hypothetical protein